MQLLVYQVVGRLRGPEHLLTQVNAPSLWDQRRGNDIVLQSLQIGDDQQNRKRRLPDWTTFARWRLLRERAIGEHRGDRVCPFLKAHCDLNGEPDKAIRNRNHKGFGSPAAMQRLQSALGESETKRGISALGLGKSICLQCGGTALLQKRCEWCGDLAKAHAKVDRKWEAREQIAHHRGIAELHQLVDRVAIALRFAECIQNYTVVLQETFRKGGRKNDRNSRDQQRTQLCPNGTGQKIILFLKCGRLQKLSAFTSQETMNAVEYRLKSFARSTYTMFQNFGCHKLGENW
mmetsp:Transcript_52859/g.132935  ORF Transcript_52859/g.132935 Transcript_52859/m.132935 type:complete len:290 (+) Transcript_52859:563-1432(+)